MNIKWVANIFIFLFVVNQNLLAQTAYLYEGKPVFHGAKVTGNYPGTPFLFTVPATGERPIRFAAEGLPTGLSLDEHTGIITGTVHEKGNYDVDITATNAQGETKQRITISIGDKLCLTPPMGWNTWNVFTGDINEKMLMEMADAMVNNGMRDIGYQYINIDDFWHAAHRDSLTGKPVVDPVKFPNGMAYLADYIHSKGLKLGIYSDAGTKTCGGCFGGYKFEEIDAKTYAEWKIDLLKYDFCHTPWVKKEAVSRYTVMGNALKNSNRSIVYSVCNWGLFDPWKWAPEAGGNYWRTTADIFDTWNKGLPFIKSIMGIVKRQNKLADYAAPGQWNDPDMLVVGNYGKGKATSLNGYYKKGMTDVEYRTHASLWAMMCAPMLASCDLRDMNEATKNILLNAELFDINQDILGKQARIVLNKHGIYVYHKPLSNAQNAWLVFNARNKNKTINLKEYISGIENVPFVRDIWLHADVPVTTEMPVILEKHEAKIYVF